MIKIIKETVAILCAVSILAAMTACQSVPADTKPTEAPTASESTPEPTKAPDANKKKILDQLEFMNEFEPDVVNSFSILYDDMVTYLQTVGMLDINAKRIDINTTDGFVKKADGTKNAVAVADKAFVFGDLYLFWWDLGDSSYMDQYESLNKNNGMILFEDYSIATIAHSGAFALSFRDYADAVADNAGEDVISGIIESHSTELASFGKIDNTPLNFKYYSSIEQVAQKLLEAEFITEDDFASPTELNTNNVKFAPVAKQYGNIKIYFYDKNFGDGTYDSTQFPAILAKLSEAKVADAIVADGENTISFSVDVVFGQFAFEIA